MSLTGLPSVAIVTVCLVLAPVTALRAQTDELVGPERPPEAPAGETKIAERHVDEAALNEDPEARRRALAASEPAAEDEKVKASEPEVISAAEKLAIEERQIDEASLNEDPEAQRRALAESKAQAEKDAEAAGALPPPPEPSTSIDFYGSARIHVVNTFNPESGDRKSQVGDGNSRLGTRAEWQFSPKWSLYGRAEYGIDLVNEPSSRTDLFSGEGLNPRLVFGGFDSDSLSLTYGKNWGAYYQVAGITDRFAVFGGAASGVYNAGSAGQFTGTGRADEALQARIYVNTEETVLHRFKPFNLNLQYQKGQPIPFAQGEKYSESYGASALLEAKKGITVGVAYNRAVVDLSQPGVVAAGMDGHSEALAITTRAYGSRWYAGLLVARLDNMEVTDQQRYYNGNGVEVYAQFEVRKNWWLIGGVNWIRPDADDPNIGQYRTKYGVIGGRYSFNSFKHMIYVEYRIDQGRLTDGRPLKDEITVGVRWDFGE
jgi:outer membrane protein N